LNRVEQISNRILEAIRDDFPNNELTRDQAETLRCGIGLSLSAVHAVILGTAKTKEEQEWAVKECFASVQSLMDCMKRDCERFGIDAIIETGIVTPEGEEVPDRASDTELH
jgi:hypothetical protein